MQFGHITSKTDIGGADRIASIKNVIKLDSLIQYSKVRITITSSSTRYGYIYYKLYFYFKLMKGKRKKF